MNLREFFHSERYRLFTQHAAVAILRHSATMGKMFLKILFDLQKWWKNITYYFHI